MFFFGHTLRSNGGKIEDRVSLQAGVDREFYFERGYKLRKRNFEGIIVD